MSDISYKQQFSAILIPYYAKLSATFSINQNQDKNILYTIARDWAEHMGSTLGEYVHTCLMKSIEDGQSEIVDDTIYFSIKTDWFCLSHCYANGVALITDIYDKARVFHEVSDISMSVTSELISTENLISLGLACLNQTKYDVQIKAHWEIEDADAIAQRMADLTTAHPRLLGLLILYNDEEAYDTSYYKALRPLLH